MSEKERCRQIDWLGDCCRLVRVKYLLKPAATGAPSVVIVVPSLTCCVAEGACEKRYTHPPTTQHRAGLSLSLECECYD